MLQAASLLRHGQADMAIVLAGDTLTQAVYEWYEAAHRLAPACFNHDPVSSAAGFIPGEGVVAMVLEKPGRELSRPYAALGPGCWAAGGDVRANVLQLLDGVRPDFTFCAGNGAPCAATPVTCSARAIVGEDTAIFPAQPIAAGMGEASALFHLLLALSKRPGPGQALLLGTSANGGFAALRMEIQ